MIFKAVMTKKQARKLYKHISKLLKKRRKIEKELNSIAKYIQENFEQVREDDKGDKHVQTH